MKAILALDTATSILSAALGTEDGAYWYREVNAGLTHSEILMDLVDNLFKSAALQPKDLKAVACMKGPGSFTGLRIGFAAAKGIALAMGIPLLACPTLDCIAHSWAAHPWAARTGLVIPLLDARKQRFYAALYAEGKRISPEMDANAAAIAAAIIGCIHSAGPEPIILTGPDAPLFLSRLESLEGPEPRPALDPGRLRLDPFYAKGRGLELLAVAKNRLIMNNNRQNDVMSGPEYIRMSDAEGDARGTVAIDS
jgi:tRNA threonylcarbamoyladenosine biosynthesis protein TsaB